MDELKNKEIDELLNQLLAEENRYQFESFNEDTAWEIGTWLVNHAREEQLPVTIDIRRGDHQLFHASRPGTNADNDEWIRRKSRLVSRFGHSSYYMGRWLAREGTSIEAKFLIPERDYAPHGGSFPIIIKGTGVIGSITVSGLPQEEDHKLVVRAIRHYLEKPE